MAKNSLDLRKELSLEDFYRFSQNVAFEYATSSASTAVSTLTKKYKISRSAFYTLLELSITHHLVSDKVAQSIHEKMQANLAAHGNHGYNSNVKHNKILEERKNFSAFLKKDIEYIAKYYANNPQYTKQEIATHFHFHSTKALDQILKRACIELIIPDKYFNAIRKRALDNATDIHYTVEFFSQLARYRDKAKQDKTCRSTF